MEISIISIKDEEMELSIKDEDISILYILQHELLRDDEVKFAGFALKHPLTQEYTFRIVARDPIASLEKAINTSISNVEELNNIVKAKVESI
ncbi:MAG: hypothetical protein KatS3mg003_2080 [Candidatus Nitrosocaldaceae archaeon]|nr:MAG: hypothetical protein KatS3mg003_2080 [Candidatus Nitrosocaldaceae archaeon]